jgi:ribonuclease HII
LKHRHPPNHPLFSFDEAVCPQYHQLLGVDEVGRGSLMGPVTAGAFAWKCLEQATPEDRHLLGFLNDSKKLTPAKRATLVPVLHRLGWWGIGEASIEEIAELNIQQASFLAGWRAMKALETQQGRAITPPTHFLLMDGRLKLPHYPLEAQLAVVGGDAKSAVVAGASVLAKEYRDAWVKQVAQGFTGYGWERNMGYATKQHRLAIQQLGVTPHHRPSYKLG